MGWKKILIPIIFVVALFTGCGQKIDGDGMVGKTYTQINQEEGKKMMEQDCVILEEQGAA